MLPRLASFAALLGHLRARHLVIACGLVIGLVLALGTGLLIVQSRRDDIANADRELKNLSFVLAEETDRAFQSVELVQLGLIQHLREMGIDTPDQFDLELASHEVRQELRQRIAGLPQISALALVSRRGRIISLSRTWPVPPIDVSDRDYFEVLTRDPARVSFIGVPVQDRTSSAWTILYARAFTGPDGHVIGFATAVLQLDLFEHLFAKIAVDGDPTFSLYRDDGALLARYPPRRAASAGPTGVPAISTTYRLRRTTGSSRAPA